MSVEGFVVTACRHKYIVRFRRQLNDYGETNFAYIRANGVKSHRKLNRLYGVLFTVVLKYSLIFNRRSIQ